MMIEVRLHDFCGDGCPFMEIEKEPIARTTVGEWVGGGLTCMNYRLCEFLAERLKAQKGEIHDA